LLALTAGVLGALDRQYAPAVAFGVTITILGPLGPFVVELGAPRQYVATASLVLVVRCALGTVVGYPEWGGSRPRVWSGRCTEKSHEDGPDARVSYCRSFGRNTTLLTPPRVGAGNGPT
jgi:hypothetical protein